MCNNVNIIKYLLLVFKYVIPIVLILLGFLKLMLAHKKKKAFAKFVLCLFSAIIVFILTFVVEFVLKNEFDCIRCTMENNCEEKVVESPDEEPIQSIEESQNVEKQIDSPKIEVKDGITYVDGYMIVNKTYSLPSDYVPSGAEGYQRCNECITSETMNAFKEMQADAQALGLNLYISSGYRSYTYQNTLYNNYVARDGKETADKYSARAGHSEHQTGLAFDLNTIDDYFGNTAEGKWTQDNCYKYGLILRYPKGKEDKTGYQYESWHLRYVGKELAQKLYNDGNWITMEEYFNLSSSYE